ncbi:MAG TPA: acyl carrier protein [Conexibacter sp.]|nr:acyl carrier protein [Conexibacter sp.]
MDHDPTMRAQALAILAEIAPEADLEQLDPAAPLRQELELDSFDFQRFVTGLDEELGIEVPERDYDRLATLDDLFDYLSTHATRS